MSDQDPEDEDGKRGGEDEPDQSRVLQRSSGEGSCVRFGGGGHDLTISALWAASGPGRQNAVPRSSEHGPCDERNPLDSSLR
jgi:hypothetical protein